MPKASDTLVIVCAGRCTALNTLPHLIDVLARRGLDPGGSDFLLLSIETLYGQPVSRRFKENVSLQERIARFVSFRVEQLKFREQEYAGPQAGGEKPQGFSARLGRRRRIAREVRRATPRQLEKLFSGSVETEFARPTLKSKHPTQKVIFG